MAKILIIEDSVTEQKVIKDWLNEEGHLVAQAYNSEDGIEIAEKSRPDIILMDVVLPGKSGFEATRGLRRNPETKEIPVIMISTKNQDSDMKWGLKQGAKHYLTKPFKKEDLISILKQVIADLNK